jgi:hypothetical protein
LSWSTETEINSDHFDVLYSIDAVHFTKVGTVTSKGNSAIKTKYQFIHQTPGSGDIFYRLQQVDKDGESTFSEKKYVHMDGNVIQLSPNPATSLVLVTSTVTGVPKELKIIDLNGKILLTTKLSLLKTNNPYSIG